MQIHQVVLHWRTGGDHAEVRLQALGGSGAFRVGVLDRLRFVQHHGVPSERCQLVHIVLQQAVGGEHQIERAGAIQQRGAGGGVAGVGFQGQRWGEAAGLRHPVGQYGRGRHHQRRPAWGAAQQHGQGLDGFAEAHVVGQAGAHAPLGQPRQPFVAGLLIAAQFRLQRARHFRGYGVGSAGPFEQRRPAVVRLQIRAVDELFQCQGCERIQTRRTLSADGGHRCEVVQTTTESSGKRYEAAIAQGQEAGIRIVLQQREQPLQIQHPLVVHAQLAGCLHPLRRGLHGEAQRTVVGVGDDAHGFAVGPLAAGLGGFEFLQELQAIPRSWHHQRPRRGWLRRQRRATFDELLHRRLLGVEIPLRLEIPAVHAGEHHHAAAAGGEAVAGAGDGFHRQRHGKPGVQRFQAHPGFRIRFDALRSYRQVLNAGGHAHAARRQRRHGTQQRLPGAARQLQPFFWNRLEQALMIGGEVRYLAAAGRWHVHAVRAVPASPIGFHAHHEAAVLGVVHGQLRRTLHYFYRLAGFVEHQRVAGQGMQARQAEVALLLVPVQPRGGRGDSGLVLRQQERHARGFCRQALGAVLLATGPAAALATALFAGVQPHIAAANVQRPHHAAIERRRIFRILRFRRFRQFLNDGKRILPGGRRGGQRGQRGCAQGGVVRSVGIGALELRRHQPLQRSATLGGHPGEAVGLGSAPQLPNPVHVVRFGHLVQPAPAYASEQAGELVRAPVVVAQTALGLHLGRIERQLQAQVIRLAPVPGGLDIRQQALGGGRALPRQRYQRQRERPGLRKHQPLAVPAQRIQRFVDGCCGGAVVAPQHGDQGADGGLAD